MVLVDRRHFRGLVFRLLFFVLLLLLVLLQVLLLQQLLRDDSDIVSWVKSVAIKIVQSFGNLALKILMEHPDKASVRVCVFHIFKYTEHSSFLCKHRGLFES